MPSLTQDKLAIALMDPCPLVVAGLHSLIDELTAGTALVAEDTSMQQVFERLQYQPASVLIAELHGQHETLEQGCEMLLGLCAQRPSLRVIVYTRCRDSSVLGGLLSHKNINVISRNDPLEQVSEFVRRVLSGERVLSPSIGCCLANPHSPSGGEVPLTRSENDVITQLFNGMSLSQIAERKHRSVKTISAHKCNAMRKLQVQTDSELFSLRNSFPSRFAKG